MALSEVIFSKGSLKGQGSLKGRLEHFRIPATGLNSTGVCRSFATEPCSKLRPLFPNVARPTRFIDLRRAGSCFEQEPAACHRSMVPKTRSQNFVVTPKFRFANR